MEENVIVRPRAWEKDSYRWIMFALVMSIAMLRFFAWYSPSPLLTTIMKDLKIDFSQSGTLVSIVSLGAAIFAFGGSFFVDVFGAKKTMLIALGTIVVGCILTAIAGNYPFLLLGRGLVGVGIGISAPLAAVFTNMWFPAKEKPIINSIQNFLQNFATSGVYLIVIPMYAATGNWQLVLGIVGAIVLLFMIAFAIFGKEKIMPVGNNKTKEEKTSEKQQNGIVMALGYREIRLLLVATVAALFAQSAFNTYLPAYFEFAYGLNAAEASAISGISPTFRAIGALIGGMLASASGRRKPLFFAAFMLSLVAGFGVFFATKVSWLLYISVALVGIGNGIWSPLFLLLPMELPGSNAKLVAGGIAVCNGIGQLSAFFVTTVFGWLVSVSDLRWAMVCTTLPLVISVISALMMKETGPKGTLGKAAL